MKRTLLVLLVLSLGAGIVFARQDADAQKYVIPDNFMVQNVVEDAYPGFFREREIEELAVFNVRPMDHPFRKFPWNKYRTCGWNVDGVAINLGEKHYFKGYLSFRPDAIANREWSWKVKLWTDHFPKEEGFN